MSEVPVPPFRLEARLYRPSEVAKFLGIPLPSIYVWIKANEIRTTRIGGRIFVTPSELSRLLGEGQPPQADVERLVADGLDEPGPPRGPAGVT